MHQFSAASVAEKNPVHMHLEVKNASSIDFIELQPLETLDIGVCLLSGFCDLLSGIIISART
jgi:hypothetical protein